MGFPKDEIYGLTSQMRMATVSVPSNIVEGCVRESRTEYLCFLKIAFGSLRELHYQPGLSKRLESSDKLDISICEAKIVETEKVLGALLRSMHR